MKPTRAYYRGHASILKYGPFVSVGVLQFHRRPWQKWHVSGAQNKNRGPVSQTVPVRPSKETEKQISSLSRGHANVESDFFFSVDGAMRCCHDVFTPIGTSNLVSKYVNSFGLARCFNARFAGRPASLNCNLTSLTYYIISSRKKSTENRRRVFPQCCNDTAIYCSLSLFFCRINVDHRLLSIKIRNLII